MGSTLLLVPSNNPVQLQPNPQQTENTTTSSTGDLTIVPPDIQRIPANVTMASTEILTPVSIQTQMNIQQTALNTTVRPTERVFQQQPNPQNVPVDFGLRYTKTFAPTPAAVTFQVQPYIQNALGRSVETFIQHPVPTSYQFQSISTVQQNQLAPLRPQLYQFQPISIISTPLTRGSFNSFPTVGPSYFVQDVNQNVVPHVVDNEERSSVSSNLFKIILCRIII